MLTQLKQITLKAELPEKGLRNGKHYDKKELIEKYSLVMLNENEFQNHRFHELAIVRVWTGRSRSSSTVYASIWVSGEYEAGTSGTGQAGGYGYCKVSEAVARTIANAGIKLYGSPYPHTDREVDYTKEVDIGGTGEASIPRALLAIGRTYTDLSRLAVIS